MIPKGLIMNMLLLLFSLLVIGSNSQFLYPNEQANIVYLQSQMIPNYNKIQNIMTPSLLDTLMGDTNTLQRLQFATPLMGQNAMYQSDIDRIKQNAHEREDFFKNQQEQYDKTFGTKS